MMVGEVYLLREGESASYLGDTESGPELHLSFDFRAIHTACEIGPMHEAIAKMQADFAEPGWPTWVLSNHDRQRHRTRYGTEARARAAAVLSLTTRGTPFLYAGEELGLEDAVVPPERVVDPDGRDGCRAPIPWTSDGDDETGHGWPVRPWLPFPPNASSHAASAELDDAASMHRLYRDVLDLRTRHEALRSGLMELAPADGSLLRFDRRSGGETLTVLVNFADEAVPWPSDLADSAVLLSTSGRQDVDADLGPDEAVVLQRR
jgi:alpha-glucosidase